MIQYWCYRNHKDLKCRIEKGMEPFFIESGDCPLCRSLGVDSHEFVEKKSEIYWCEKCRIPLYKQECSLCHGKGKKVAADLRPVFPEEKLLLELLMEEKPGTYQKNSVWKIGSGSYLIDGKRVVLKKKLKDYDVSLIRGAYLSHIEQALSAQKEFEKQMSLFAEANKERCQQITNEAMDYILRETKDFSLSEMFVSFSGGKDSTVVADLARRALATDRLLHIYGDTTLEFPDTEEYVKEYRKKHPKTPFLSSRNKEKNFLELCEMIGPPSRVMRWCCTIFKTGAINRKISSVFRNQQTILSFQGIRRSESASRSKYDRTSKSSKIARQIVLAPIIDWMDFDNWLYLLTNKMDFNPAYRKGYSRVGCWCCPNNSTWSEFLSRIHMPEKYQEFREFLVRFAKEIGKPDAEEYVESGAWKARQGGNGVDYAKNSIVSYEPCVKEENAFNYELQKPLSKDFYELFQPFGTLNFELGNQRLGEVYLLNKKKEPVMKLQGKTGRTKLKVTIFDVRCLGVKSLKAAKEKIDCQITKYQMCMGCRGCESICRWNAITVKEMPDQRISYRIDEKKCTGCRECVSHYVGGCYMRKVLAIKR